MSSLMDLLALYLRKEVNDMNAKGVRLKVVGDTSDVDVKIQAVKSWHAAHPGKTVDTLDEASLNAHLGLAYAPDPDLLIRTGGESRIGNFTLWQLAYTETFFTDGLWPSFTADELDQAITCCRVGDRRFGGAGTLSVVKA